MPATSCRKRSSQFNTPSAKRFLVNKPQHVRPHILTTSHNEDPYATANLTATLEQLQKEAFVRQQRREQSDCVRRASILFDVFGYVVMIPRLQTEYKGSLIIKDWHDDVRALLERSFKEQKLSEKQKKLVETVEKVAISDDLLTYEQWRCLLCLNLMAGASGKGKTMKIIHLEEVQKVKELATRVLDGTKQSTVLQLVNILEKSE